MIEVGETTAELRRIRVAIYVEDGSALALDAATGLAPGHVQVSINGAAFVNAGGTLAHIGSGLYYYEATAGEVATGGFLLVKYERTGYKKDGWWDSVGQIFALEEDDGTKLRLPIAIFNDASPPELTTGATVAVPSELQTTANGAAYVDADGELNEIGDGFYYYQATTADSGTEGWFIVKYEKTGFQLCSSGIDVEDPLIGSVSTALIDATSPGDLAEDPTEARFTPVHLEFDAAIGYSVVIQAQIGTDSALWMAVYDEKISGATGQDAYAPLFATKSTIDITGTIGTGRNFVMDILPNGGWQREQFRIVPYLALELT